MINSCRFFRRQPRDFSDSHSYAASEATQATVVLLRTYVAQKEINPPKRGRGFEFLQ